MDAARQVLRFSIPGSLLILWAAGGVMLILLVMGDSLEDTTAALRVNVAPVVAVLASIPVGFLVYQLYYVFYRPIMLLWPHRWHGRWVRLDRGAQVLNELQPTQIQALRDLLDTDLEVSEAHDKDEAWPHRWLGLLKLSDEYVSRHGDRPSAAEVYRSRWYDNWDVLRAIIDISDATEATRGIKREYVALSDLYHALGATRTALTAAWVFAGVSTGIAAVQQGDGGLHWAIGVVMSGSLTAAVWFVLHQTRRQTWKSARKSLVYGLRWIFDNHPDLFEPSHDGPGGEAGRIYKLRRQLGQAVLPEPPP
jgi:hypothetical protein